ncbi:hypothetical protein BDW74DRAFT_170035 [Aspergillus multicolor]|uniref:isopenicillin N synthase family dioxygenase n=1 Tax=Aspergillus multicolor TaxID=41759 RepID=UPI003CCD13F8
MASQEADFDSIPIVDLSTLVSPHAHERQKLADLVSRACTEVGFFYIINHGIPGELIDRTFEAARKFFAMNEEQKMSCYLGKSKNFRGYSPLYGEKASNPELEEPEHGALSEAFDIGYELAGDLRKGPDDPPPQDGYGLHGDNQWPDERLLPGFRGVYLDYFSQVLELSRKLIRILALALDQKEDFFDSAVEYPGVASRMLHYPPQPIEGKGIPGQAAHTDWECFTILAQDHVPGLQVHNNQGKWVLAPPIPGTLVVNIADCLSTWSNFRFKSTVHRVVNLTGLERYSIPFFFGVDYNTTISIMENLFSGEKPSREPFTAGEYVHRKLSNGYIGYEGE